MKNADLGGHMKIKKLAAVCLAGTLAVSALGGCGINKDEVVATYDSREVTLGIVNFMCRYQQSYYDEAYRGYFGDDVWQQDLSGSGQSLQEDVKTDVVEGLHEMYTLQDHMDEYDIEITGEEQEKISSAAAAFMAANSSDTLEEMGATQEIVEEVLTLYTIQSKMYDAIIALADTDVSDEEANMRGYTYVRASLSGYYDSEYNYVSYTEDELAQMNTAFSAMAEAAAEDPENFEAIAEAAGYTAATDAYNADSSLDEDVMAALDALGEGEVSGVIETDYYLYLVRLDSETDADATEQNRQDIIEDRQSTFYTDTVFAWQEDDGWTVNEKVLAKIKFESAFSQAEETEAATEEDQ
jgi:foldase protein PrsA